MTGASQDGVICLPQDGGRRYAMGRLTALFKADGAETGERYSGSEWLLDPGQTGVGTHAHETNDEIYLVLDGNPEFLLDETWTPCPTGTFLRILAVFLHDFRNPGPGPARLFRHFIGDGFERNMPAIMDWFAAREPPA